MENRKFWLSPGKSQTVLRGFPQGTAFLAHARCLPFSHQPFIFIKHLTSSRLQCKGCLGKATNEIISTHELKALASPCRHWAKDTEDGWHGRKHSRDQYLLLGVWVSNVEKICRLTWQELDFSRNNRLLCPSCVPSAIRSTSYPFSPLNSLVMKVF